MQPKHEIPREPDGQAVNTLNGGEMGAEKGSLSKHEPESFQRQLDELYSSVLAPSPGHIHDYRNLSGLVKEYGYLTEKGKDFFENQRSILETVVSNPSQNYFLQVVAKTLLTKLHEKGEPLYISDDIYNLGYLPFEIAKNRFATFVGTGDLKEKKLVVAPVEDSDAIRDRLEQLRAIEDSDEYKERQRFLREVEVDFGNWDEANNWPLDLYRKYVIGPRFEFERAVLVTRLQGHFLEPSEYMGEISGIPYEHLIATDKDLSQSREIHPTNAVSLYYSPDISKRLSEELGIDLIELTLRERYYFFQYISSHTGAEIEVVKKFIGQYGLIGFRTFLSLEKGGKELGDKIIEFGSNTEVAPRVFRSYCTLLDSADVTEEYVRSNIDCKTQECSVLIEKVRENLLTRSQQLLTSSVTATNIESVLKKLDHFSVSGALFASAFKELRKRGDINWETLKEATFEQVSGPDISEADQAVMADIWESHYKGKYDAEYEQKIRQSFQDSFRDHNTHYYIFRQAGDVVSYFSSKNLGVGEDGLTRRYLGSFMSHQGYEGGGLGQVVLEKGLAEEQKDSILKGDCDVDPIKTPIISKYFEEFGFVGTEWYIDGKTPTLALERWEGDHFNTKNPKLTQKVIKDRAEAGSPHPNERYIKSATVPDFEESLRDGYYLTRYFAYTDLETKTSAYYAVLERPSSRPVKVAD